MSWPSVALEDCCELITDGTHHSPISAASGEYMYVTSKNIRPGRVELDDVSFVSKSVHDEIYRRCPVQHMDVLYVKDGVNAGTAALNTLTVPFSLLSSVALIRPRLSQLNERYLVHWLNDSGTQSVLLGAMSGSAIRRLVLRDIRRFSVPLPPLAEQRRIADILDKADAIRRKRKQAIALTEELLRSVFLEMFGDPVTNPKRWPARLLGELLTFLTSGSRGWARYYAESGDLFLRIQNVCDDQLDLADVAYVRAPDTAEARRTKVEPGDVLLSITADLGRTAVVPDGLPRAFINQHLAILRTAGVEPEYLSAFLASAGGQQQFQRLNRHGVKAGLNFDDIRGVQVLMPPVSEQRHFVRVKLQIRAFQQKLIRAAAEADVLMKALVQRAFRGELTRSGASKKRQLELFAQTGAE